MFDVPTIQASFLTLVGWRQNEDPSGRQLTSLLTSDSGIYLNDVSPLLSVNNLAAIAPNFDLFTYPDWSGSTAYTGGQVVVRSSVRYRCKLAHTNQQPPNSTYWETWSNDKALTKWLQDRMHGSATALLNEWANKKIANRTTKALLEREQVFTSTGSNQDTCPNLGDKMAGLEIGASRSQSLKCTLHKVSLHLEEAQNLTLYLYKTGNKNYTQSIELAYTAAGDVQWFDLGWTLDGNGAYYLCYSLNDLSGKAYNDANERTAYSHGEQQPGGVYYNVAPFTADIINVAGVGAEEVNTFTVGGSDVFVTSKLGYTNQTQGLNLKLSIACDFTDLVIEQRTKFAEAYSLHIAKALLRELAYNGNANLNRLENNIRREEVLFEINGDPQGRKTGIGAQYDMALAAIQFDTSSIDPICLTCNQRAGLRVGTVYR